MLDQTYTSASIAPPLTLDSLTALLAKIPPAPPRPILIFPSEEAAERFRVAYAARGLHDLPEMHVNPLAGPDAWSFTPPPLPMFDAADLLELPERPFRVVGDSFPPLAQTPFLDSLDGCRHIPRRHVRNVRKLRRLWRLCLSHKLTVGGEKTLGRLMVRYLPTLGFDVRQAAREINRGSEAANG